MRCASLLRPCLPGKKTQLPLLTAYGLHVDMSHPLEDVLPSFLRPLSAVNRSPCLFAGRPARLTHCLAPFVPGSVMVTRDTRVRGKNDSLLATRLLLCTLYNIYSVFNLLTPGQVKERDATAAREGQLKSERGNG